MSIWLVSCSQQVQSVRRVRLLPAMWASAGLEGGTRRLTDGEAALVLSRLNLARLQLLINDRDFNGDGEWQRRGEVEEQEVGVVSLTSGSSTMRCARLALLTYLSVHPGPVCGGMGRL